MPTNEDYTVGWIAALPIELASAQAMLDEEHEDLDAAPGDTNTYSLGRVGKHNIVIAGLPVGVIGTTAAANAATNLLRSFRNIRFGLLVGIGGGVPQTSHDVRLGDIVISTPWEGAGGVIQFDLGTSDQNSFHRWGSLRDPPTVVQTAVSKMSATAMRKGYKFDAIHGQMLKDNARMTMFARPTTDILYEADYVHVGGDCSNCDPQRRIPMEPRNESVVHFGLIGSGNRVIANAILRDKLHGSESIICFEMEAAGLMKDFECLVIRGICDYCDSHKNRAWHPYAGAIAAAYAKELLLTIPAQQVEEMPKSKILDSIDESLRQITNQYQDLLSSRRDEEVKKAETWIGAVDPEQNFLSALSRREPGTGTWFLDSDVYTSWRNGPVKHLWLFGKAGCGKSVLSATAIEDLRFHCGSEIGFAMFYFTFSDNAKQSWSDCMRSLIIQLTTTKSAVSSLVNAYKKSNAAPTERDLEGIFNAAIRSYARVFIVLDALDESPETLDGEYSVREKLLMQLTRLARTLPNIKLFLTSRDLPEIRQITDLIQARSVSFVAELVNKDIGKYVRAQLNRHSKLSTLNSKTKEEVEETLMKQADGMFRWVYCQLQRLKNLKLIRPSTILKTLTALPKTLDETYQRMLEAIDEDSFEDAFVLLRWLAYARRPLTIDELFEVLVIDLELEVVNIDDRPAKPEGLLELLSGLIKTYDAETGSLTKYRGESDMVTGHRINQRTLVELAHFSVKEYLESSRVFNSKFQLDAQRENNYLSSSCLVYLTHCAGYSIAISPMLDYSVEYWPEHSKIGSDPTRLTLFLKSEETVALWGTLYNEDRTEGQHGRSPGSGLYYAIMYRFESVVRALIESGIDITAAVKPWANSLGIAAFYGDTDLVELLINLGADVQSFTDDMSTVLDSAILGGHLEVSKLLIEAGADVNGVNPSNRGRPLSLASLRGHQMIVKALIEHGADVNEASISYGCPLYAASLEGHTEVVQILLEAGARIEAQREHTSTTALQIAAEYGQLPVVRKLIESGADVNYKGKVSTALFSASKNGHTEIVDLLISHGATDNLPSQYSDTALTAASAKGYSKIVKLLQKIHASPGSLDVRNTGLLKLVSSEQSYDAAIVKVLLDYGVDVNARDRQGNSALILASNQNRADVVQMLLANSANVDQAGYHLKTGLHAAAENGSVDIMNMLLDSKAEVDPLDDRKRTPLHAAAANGHDEAVQGLLSAGANVNSVADKDETPLMLAILQSKFSALPLLLNAGASMRAHHRGSTPMHEVVRIPIQEYFSQIPPRFLLEGDESQRLAVLKLLLEGFYGSNKIQGIGINERSTISVNMPVDRVGRSVLHNAARYAVSLHYHWATPYGENLIAFDYLIDYGFNIDALDKQGKTVLDYACLSGSTSMVKRVLQLKSSATYTESQWSPFHWACRGASFEVLKLLSDAGEQASVVKTVSPDVFWTPMDIAVYHSNQKLEANSDTLKNHDWQSLEKSGLVEYTGSSNSLKYHAYRRNSFLFCNRKDFLRMCDGCEDLICGITFRCETCLVIEYCLMCKHDSERTHPGHTWSSTDAGNDDRNWETESSDVDSEAEEQSSQSDKHQFGISSSWKAS